MKYLDGNYYVVKDHRYEIHPTENIILRKRDPPKSLTTQYQVKNNTKIRTNQKVIRNDDNQLIVKNYPKNKQPIIQQRNFDLPNRPNCKQKTWLEFDKGYYCRNCEYIINKQKHQINKNIHRQDHDFSNRLIYAKNKIREIYISIANFSEDDIIENLQLIKGGIKLKFYKNISDYYKEMKNKNFQSNKIDPFSKNAKGIGKIYHEVLLLMEFSQTKPDIKNMNFNYVDLYYTVIKTRDGNKNIDNQYENDYHDYIDINDFLSAINYTTPSRETLSSLV